MNDVIDLTSMMLHELGCRVLKITMLYVHQFYNHVCVHMKCAMKHYQVQKATSVTNYTILASMGPNAHKHDTS